MPRRPPPMQGHWAQGNAWQQTVEEENAALISGRQDPSNEGRTPRSLAEYSMGGKSSVASEAPEFYEEEPVTLARIEEVLAIEHGLRESCKTLPITIASWVFFTLLIFYHGQIQGSYDCAASVRESMLEIDVPAVNSTLRHLRLGSITERYDIIQWIHHGLVPAVTVSGLKHGQLQRTQQLVGKISVSQTRGAPKNCDMNSHLKRFYSGQCNPQGDGALAYGTNKLDYASAFEPSNLGSSKGKFVAWLDIGRPMKALNEQFQSLLDFKWLDDNSQEVTIEAMFLNAEMNAFSMMEIVFNLHRGGWIQQDIKVTPMRGDVYYHWAVVWLDVMWVFVMLLFIAQVAWHAYEEIKKGLWWYWLTDTFVLLDFASLFVGIVMAIYFWYLSVRWDDYTDRVAALGPMPKKNVIEASMAWKTRYILQNWYYEKDVRAIFDDFKTIHTLTEWQLFIAFVYNIIIVCRFYRGFTGQPRIAVLLQTFDQVAYFLLHYLIIFVVVLATFTVGGYILFGEQLKGWSTLGKATGSAFLVLFGRFDYEAMHGVAPVSACVWFVSFFALAVLMMMGVMTSAILHQYLGVRQKTGQAGESVVRQLSQVLDDCCYNRTYDGAQKTMPPDKLFEMIITDTDPLRIRRLGRFHIDRRLRTRHDVHEAELDPKIDVDFLIDRGMDYVSAERFLQRVAESGHHLEQRSTPLHRLTIFLARQMSQLRYGAERMRKNTSSKVTWAARSVDRLDLKHAKCVALARRIRRAQELPPGWTSHVDQEGRRYLRQEETGLTSWTLPRHLI